MSDNGRPSQYNEEYHPSKLIELMSQGKLDCEIYSFFNISKSTFLRWRKEYEAFDEAYQIGLPKSESITIINPLREMIETKNDKGYKPLAHLARNKFGHDQNNNVGTVNNTQINIGQMQVNNKIEYDKLLEEVKDKAQTLNLIDIIPVELHDGHLRSDESN